jgi:maltose-binding protein MalE
MKTTILIIMLALIVSCALFQKTRKTSQSSTQSSNTKLETSQLVLKSDGKETRIFTYWNDSGFYQYQHIKEQVDQARLNSLKAKEKQQAKQTVVTKKTEPVSGWIYVVVFIGGVVGYLVLKRF